MVKTYLVGTLLGRAGLALGLALIIVATASARQRDGALNLAAYVTAIQRYAAGESTAEELASRQPAELTDALRSLLNSRPPVCADERCRQAGALLHTEAAAITEGKARSGDAHLHLDIARALLGLHGSRSTVLKDRSASPEHAWFQRTWLKLAGRYELGNAHLSESTEFLELAIVLSPDDVEALTALAALHELAGTVEGLVEPPPEAAHPPFWRRHQMSRSLDLAVEYCKDALEFDPSWHEARLRLARVEQRRGRVTLARAKLERVAREAGSPLLLTLAHLFLGQLAETEKAIDSAATHYRTAIRLTPGSQAARLALSALFRARGAEREAGAEVEALLDREGEAADVWLAYSLGFPERALDDLNRLREVVLR